MWHHCPGFVGGRFRKGRMVCAHLDVRHLSLPLPTIGTPEAAIPLLELRGSESVQVSLCVGFLRRTALGSSNFSHRLNPHWFLQSEVVETYLPVTGTLLWSAWCGAGTPQSRHIPPIFLSTTRGCGTSSFCIIAPPTSLD